MGGITNKINSNSLGKWESDKLVSQNPIIVISNSGKCFFFKDYTCM